MVDDQTLLPIHHSLLKTCIASPHCNLYYTVPLKTGFDLQIFGPISS